VGQRHRARQGPASPSGADVAGGGKYPGAVHADAHPDALAAVAGQLVDSAPAHGHALMALTQPTRLCVATARGHLRHRLGQEVELAHQAAS
jgi:hypothetical protein